MGKEALYDKIRQLHQNLLLKVKAHVRGEQMNGGK